MFKDKRKMNRCIMLILMALMLAEMSAEAVPQVKAAQDYAESPGAEVTKIKGTVQRKEHRLRRKHWPVIKSFCSKEESVIIDGRQVNAVLH